MKIPTWRGRQFIVVDFIVIVRRIVFLYLSRQPRRLFAGDLTFSLSEKKNKEFVNKISRQLASINLLSAAKKQTEHKSSCNRA